MKPYEIIFHLDREFKELDGKKPHQKYQLKNGDYVPGVTTVLGVLNKPALLNWSAKVERENLLELFKRDAVPDVPEKLFYLTIRDTAASVGSCAHFISECFITSKNPRFISYENEMVEKAKLSFNKFQKFWETSGFTLVASEEQLVSETHAFGGTLDIVARDQQDRYTLIDIKTSGAVYSEYWTQVSAYRQLWNENHPDQKIENQIIVRIGKTELDDFEIVEIKDAPISYHFQKFLATLKVYQMDKIIKAWKE